MRRSLTFLAALALAASLAGAAGAQKIDANGRCHAANGQFAKAEVCGGLSRSTTKTTTTATHATTTTTAPPEATVTTKCRDPKGHFIKCGPATAASAPAAPAAPAKAARCKNDKGKFAKCGSPGAHPA
jgi:hypothetical protein